MTVMETLMRAGRAYWQWNERAWTVIRRFAIPILILFGIAALAAWFVGERIGDPVLVCAPAAFAWALLVGVVLADR